MGQRAVLRLYREGLRTAAAFPVERLRPTVQRAMRDMFRAAAIETDAARVAALLQEGRRHIATIAVCVVCVRTVVCVVW